MTHSYVTWLIYNSRVSAGPRFHVTWRVHMWRDAFTCGMTHSAWHVALNLTHEWSMSRWYEMSYVTRVKCDAMCALSTKANTNKSCHTHMNESCRMSIHTYEWDMSRWYGMSHVTRVKCDAMRALSTRADAGIGIGHITLIRMSYVTHIHELWYKYE